MPIDLQSDEDGGDEASTIESTSALVVSDVPMLHEAVEDLPAASVLKRNRSQEEKAAEIRELNAGLANMLETLPESAGMPDLPFAHSRDAPAVTQPASKPAKRKPAKSKEPAVEPKPKPKPKAKPKAQDVDDCTDDLFGSDPSDTEPESEPDDTGEEDEQFTMEKITGQRTTASGAVQYKIKWLGFSEQTWEPESNILDRSVIDEYVAVQAKVCAHRSRHASQALLIHVCACTEETC